MFLLASKSMKNKWKSFLFQISIIALSFTLLGSIVPAYDAMIEKTDYAYQEKYGDYYAIAYDLTEESNGLLQADEFVSESGFITNYGRFAISASEQQLSIGYFDDTALSYSHFKVLDGSLPTQAGEIALEEHTTYQTSTQIKVGDTLELMNAEGHVEAFLVTGIIKDYSSSWPAPTEIFRGINDLPSGIVSEQNKAMSPISKTCLLKTKTLDFEAIAGLGNRINIDFNNFQINISYHSEGASKIQNYVVVKRSIIAAILLSSALAVFSSIYLNLRKNIKTYDILQLLGAGQNNIFLMFFLQNCILYILALPIAACLIAVIQFVLSATGLFEIKFILSTHLKLAFLLFSAAYYSIVIFLYFTVLRKRKNKTYSQLWNNKTHRMRVRNGMVLPITLSGLKSNSKKVIAAVCVMGLLISCVTYTQIRIQALTIEEDLGIPDFSINDVKTVNYVKYDAFPFYRTKGRGFEHSGIIILDSIDEIGYIHAVPELDGAIPYFPNIEQNKYWYNWSVTKEYNALDQAEYPYPEILPNDVIGVTNFSFFVVKESDTEVIERLYPGVFSDSFYSGEGAILFLPNNNNQNIYLPSSVLFGRLESEADFENARSDPELMSFQVTPVKILNWVEENFCFQNECIDLNFLNPTFIVSETMMENSVLFQGYQSLDIYLAQNDISINEEAYRDIYCKIQPMAFSNPNGTFFSFRDMKEDYKKQAVLMWMTQIIIIVSLGLYVFISVLNILYASLLERRKSFGIYRAVGLSKNQLWKTLFFELSVYSFAGSFLGIMANIVVYSFIFYAPNTFSIFAVPIASLFVFNLLGVAIAAHLTKIINKTNSMQRI